MGPPGSSREDPFIRVQPPDLPGGLNEDTNSKEPETELLRLLMHNGSVAPLAELFDLQLLRLLLLVHRRRIVAPLAGRADQPNDIGHNRSLPFRCKCKTNL